MRGAAAGIAVRRRRFQRINAVELQLESRSDGGGSRGLTPSSCPLNHSDILIYVLYLTNLPLRHTHDATIRFLVENSVDSEVM
ncbi:hypothetical protein Baya_15949 [Bagarius yarrelli]|uniref:Uncharacterized protein n=1 Tax=Bagarius yarrelli TaxID=175774 RepID=A0A556VU08_BAGYA|nr:hypothetical protein Baya_15949 [Bagarius yarrelli]